MSFEPREVLVTGASGVLGRALVPALLAQGLRVRALRRTGSRGGLPSGAETVAGDPLLAGDVARALGTADTLVLLVGTPKPAPWKAAEFRRIDRGSVEAALAALPGSCVRHVVYVSVAQPAPVMRAYVGVRAACEARLRASGIPLTVLRPWYVLGPGRRWPLLLLPFYALLERIPATAPGARRLGLVTLAQMRAALAQAVRHPTSGARMVEVPEIRRAEDGAP